MRFATPRGALLAELIADIQSVPELPNVSTGRPRANLDLLRAVAVILVVVDHTCLALNIHRSGSWDPGWLGMMGVYMFFVHTTLVLMWSLERRPDVLDFYVRRVFRIYPLALLAIAIAVLARTPTAGTVTHFFGRPAQTWKSILTQCLLMQDLRPYTPPLVNVMWTLPFEVQMYVVLPVLFAFGRQSRRIWPLFLVWFLTVLFCRATFPDINTVNLATVVPMFLPGVISYVIFRRRGGFLPAWAFAVFLLCITAVFMFAPSNRMGWYISLALGLCIPQFRDLRAKWLVRPSHHLATYSYGIYLSHPFGLVLGMYLLRGHSVWLQLTVELATISFASVAAYHLLEAPMIHLGADVAARVCPQGRLLPSSVSKAFAVNR